MNKFYEQGWRDTLMKLGFRLPHIHLPFHGRPPIKKLVGHPAVTEQFEGDGKEYRIPPEVRRRMMREGMLA